MTAIFDFTMKSRSGSFGPQVIEKLYNKHFRATNRKNRCHLHFDSHLFYVHLTVNVAAILDLFFFQNLVGSTVCFWFAKVLQISHIIVSIFIGVFIVTVNISKWRTY